MFLYNTVLLITALACSYCLHGKRLCFFIRHQTLVSSILNLPWALNEVEGVLGLVSTLSDIGNVLFWLD